MPDTVRWAVVFDDGLGWCCNRTLGGVGVEQGKSPLSTQTGEYLV